MSKRKLRLKAVSDLVGQGKVLLPKIKRDPGLPDAAYSPTGARYHMVRIALPENKNDPAATPRYYREGGNVSWVTTGYKTWPIDEWKAAYGRDYLVDIRNWDFFGEEINIWEGYSEE